MVNDVLVYSALNISGYFTKTNHAARRFQARFYISD